METIKIEDESGDKKYFSQIPHYILNHSTANDQALYLQMKRFAGETGKCFATQETLMKRLGISDKAYKNSLNYLLEKGWIRFVGMTASKTRPIKTYAIVDIWKLNILHYEEISVKRRVSSKGEINLENVVDTPPKKDMIHPQSAIEEDLTNKNNKEESAKQSFAPVNVKSFFRKTEKGGGEKNDNGVPMNFQEFALMCKGSEYRHICLIGEYAESREFNHSTRGQWRVFGLRNMRVARLITPFNDRQIDDAITKIEKDLKSNKGFISSWTMETLEKYLHKK